MPTFTIDVPGVRVVDNVYTREECAAFVALAERHGFDDAPITLASGPAMRPDIRNNRRAMWDDPEEAARLWARLQPLAPHEDGVAPTSLNERLRVYRYVAGERFNWHYDGSYQRPDRSERSSWTVMIYLNGGGDLRGGETLLEVGLPLHALMAETPDGDNVDEANGGQLAVPPRPGRVIFFRHRLFHCGSEVIAGHKDVLRTDVMFPRLR